MNTHEDYRREVTVKRPLDRSFGLWMALVFAVAAVWPALHGHSFRLWALAVSALLVAIAALCPTALHYPNVVWTGFGILLSRVTQPIVMTFLFFGVFTPIGFVMRRLGKSPLRAFRDPAIGSYWENRVPPGPSPESMLNQF